MGGTISNLFLGIVGINMVLIGGAVVLEAVAMSIKKKREVMHIRSIISLFGGTTLLYFGVHFVGQFFGY
ncbi:MAG: hypothetical protein K9L30_16310 [Desulfobacterales bacterium]|nr:hypothetical protein [Desulfobacterales bacterium]